VPLVDLSGLDAYKPPAPPPLIAADFEAAKSNGARHRANISTLAGRFMIWEQMHSYIRTKTASSASMDDSRALTGWRT